MARTATIRDETILDAAREVFLARGVQGTTAEVAERAGISEGTIFNRFRSKDELFRAAMMQPGAAIPWAATLDRPVEGTDTRTRMIELGLDIIDFFRKLMPLMMMSWSNRGPHKVPGLLEQPDPPPAVAMRRLMAYFESEARAGRIRPTNAAVLARTFLGGLQNFVFFELLLAGREPSPLGADEFVRGHVALLWSAIAPET
ncbi:MAG: helix-turn-helix domain-containing protein [Polyangiaceae bacterium]